MFFSHSRAPEITLFPGLYIAELMISELAAIAARSEYPEPTMRFQIKLGLRAPAPFSGLNLRNLILAV